jgi:hypothetical protein
MHGIKKIGTQRVINNHKKALCELTTYMPKISTAGNMCKTAVQTLSCGHNFHTAKSESPPHPSLGNVEPQPKWPSHEQAQPSYEPTDLKSRGVMFTNKLEERRAKGRRSAEVIIKLSLLSPHRKIVIERKRSFYNMNTIICAYIEYQYGKHKETHTKTIENPY